MKKIHGFIEGVGQGTIFGWAYDPGSPNVPITVSVRANGRCIATAVAAEYRRHLKDAGIGNGCAGFTLRIDGQEWRAILESIGAFTVSTANPETGEEAELAIPPRISAELRARRGGSFLHSSRLMTYELVVACIIKNEAHYIEEWIAYHLAKGVQHFLIYDNNSTDRLYEVVQPYSDLGIVTVIPWPNFVEGELRRRRWHEQDVAYLNAYRRMAGIAEWVACIDIDEFIATTGGTSIVDVLAVASHGDAATLYWRFFGSSGHEKRHEGLVIEKFNHHDPGGLDAGEPYKVVVRPDQVGWLLNAHTPVMARDGAVGANIQGRRYWTSDEARAASDFSRIWINHYHVKSLEEYKEKVLRGWPENTGEKNIDWAAFFESHDRNEVEDNTLFPYGRIVRDIISTVNTKTTASSEPIDDLTAGELLLSQIRLRRDQDRIVLDGFALDLAHPKTRVKVVVEDIMRTKLGETICDAPAPEFIDDNFVDGRLGFTLSLAAPEGPISTLRIRMGRYEIFRHLPAENLAV
jgi:hypothetical protein